MHQITQHEKIKGAIWGCAIGDALGLPFEKKTQQEIADNFSDITHYLPVKHNGFIQADIARGKNPSVNPESTGLISDDTIFTLAGLRSIVQQGTIDIQHLFDTHKNLFDQYGETRFGGNIRKNLRSYTGDLATLHSDSRGNGIMMKQLPYALYLSHLMQTSEYELPHDYVDNTIARITSITHDSPIAKLTAIMHNKTLMYLLSSTPETLDMKKLLEHLAFIAPFHEQMMGLEIQGESNHSIEKTHQLAGEILAKIESTPPQKIKMITNQQNPMEAKSIDTSHESDFNMDEVIRIANERFPQKDTSKTMNNPDCAMRITPILKKLLTQQERIDAGNPYSLDEIIETYTIQLADTKNNATLKPGFHVASTFGLVYACFLQHQDFEGLLNAIRIGYDTDSQAAIIGAMIGALRGPFYDPSYIEGLADKETIAEDIAAFLTVTS